MNSISTTALQNPDDSTPEQGTWKELLLLRQSVRALLWLLMVYLVVSTINKAINIRQLVSIVSAAPETFEPLSSFSIVYRGVRDFLAFLCPLLFVAFWLWEARLGLRKCVGRDGRRNLPVPFAFLRRTFIVLSLVLCVYLAWYVYFVEWPLYWFDAAMPFDPINDL